MPKYRHLLIFALVVTFLLIGLYIFKNTQVKNAVESADVVSATTQTNSTVARFDYNCEGNKSAFEVLDNYYEIQFNESSLGNIVTAINGEAQREGKYWLYSIDGQEATVGASNYICKGGEQIVWELK